MFNFELKIPTEIYFGIHSEDCVGTLLSRFSKKVMMIYGSNRIFDTGLGDEIVQHLKRAGCQVTLCGGVKPNGELEFINHAIEKGRQAGVDGLLAVGGGSVIDTAKAISAGFYYHGDVTDLYLDKSVPCRFLPLGAIVTIPATASESNGMSVIWDKKSGKKLTHFFQGVKPKFALLNPQLTLSVSGYQTAVGGFDVFAHAFERYFDLRRNSQLLDAMTEGVMQTVIKVLLELVENPDDIDLRSEMMLAATVAHNDMLGPGGDFACHQISHIFTERYGISHGGALAMIIPAWCEYMQERRPDRFIQFYQKVWGEKNLDEGLRKLKQFVSAMGLPLQIKGDEDEAKILAKMCMDKASSIGGNFKLLTETDIVKILEKIIIPVA